MPDNRLTEPLADQFARVPTDWRDLTDAFAASPAGQALVQRVEARQTEGAVIYPGDVFAALRLTRRADVRVVILGQDPYHGPGQAHGLAFSVLPGVKLPPSLRNIYKELHRDLGLPIAKQGCLAAWAGQGVWLLNTSLTVEAGEAASHAKWGWEVLTDALIAAVAADPQPKAFLLWGAHAQRKRPLIEAAGGGHLVLTANHPSPLSASRPPEPFIGCGHFGKASHFLGQRAPDWTVRTP
ncbi:MAG TPA: uracil-DNA glycosylase [Candidatus Aquabacterium excrementipullorum]|nr:uracil-DNA glycosylase [Candidatus Aquabacterium excrementipullorum]